MDTKIAATAAVMLFAGGAALAQDAEAGQRVFARRCATCHAVTAPDGATIVRGGEIGPNQYGVHGGQAGGRDDFDRYGDALVSAGRQGLVWSDATLVAYLRDPQGFLREFLGDGSARSRMAFRLRDEQDARDVAAYLATFSE